MDAATIAIGLHNKEENRIDFERQLASLGIFSRRGSFFQLRRCSSVTNLDSLLPRALHLKKISRVFMQRTSLTGH